MKKRLLGIVLSIVLTTVSVGPAYADFAVEDIDKEIIDEIVEAESSDEDIVDEVKDDFWDVNDAQDLESKLYTDSIPLLTEGDFDIDFSVDPRDIYPSNDEIVTGAPAVSIYDKIYDSIVAGKYTIDVSEYNIPIPSSTDRTMSNILGFVINSNPEIFYMDGAYSYYKDSTYITSIILSRRECFTDEDIEIYNAAVDEAYIQAMKTVDNSSDDLDKLLGIHNYIVNNCEYDKITAAKELPTNEYKSTYPKEYNSVHSAFGAIVNGVAVCQGYAQAYSALCKKAGIECEYVVSSPMNHAWNMVKLGGKYYHIDATWDDPTWNRVGLVGHNYFLIDDDTMISNKNHHDWITQDNHVADSTKYISYYWVNEGVSSPIIKKDGYYYYSAYNTNPQIIKRNADGDETTLITMNKWPAQTGYTWSMTSSGLFVLYNRLFYNDYSSIKSVNFDGTDNKTEYAISDSSKNIYGVSLEKGEVHYGMRGRISEEVNSKDYNKYVPYIIKLSELASYEPPCEHVFGEYAYNNNETCEMDGTETAVCTKCGETDTRIKAGTKLGHQFTEYIYNDDADCTTDGTEAAICERCGKEDVRFKENTKLEHIWIDAGVVKEPTHKAEGSEKYICDRCGNEKFEPIPKLEFEVPVTEGTDVENTYNVVLVKGGKTEPIEALAKIRGERIWRVKYSKKGYASVSNKGVVKGSKVGSIVAEITTEHGIYTVNILITQPAFPKGALVINKGDTNVDLGFSGTELEPIYSSQKPLLVEVDSITGEVTGLAYGKSKITVNVGGKKYYRTVSVLDPTLTGKNEVRVKKRITLQCKRGEKKTTDWNSSDESIATVDQRGRVLGVSAGEVVITAKNHGVIISKTVTVVDPSLK